MIHLLLRSLIWSLISRLIGYKILALVGVMLLAMLLAMTGIGIVVLLFLGKWMMTMMADNGWCSCMGAGDEPESSEWHNRTTTS